MEVAVGAGVGVGVIVGVTSSTEVAVGTEPPHPSTANTNPTTIRTHKGFIPPPYHTPPPDPVAIINSP